MTEGFTRSSGNVFKDAAVREPEKMLAKAELVRQITRIARHRRLSQKEVAGILGTSQPNVSNLYAGRISGFSLDRLIRFLNALDLDVAIVVTRKPGRSRRPGRTTVSQVPLSHKAIRPAAS